MFTISSFKSIENKHDVYRGKDFMKKFCKSLTYRAMKMINFKRKKMLSLTKELQESYENTKICYVCKEKFENKYWKDKNIKLKVIVIIQRGCTHSICNLKYT